MPSHLKLLNAHLWTKGIGPKAQTWISQVSIYSSSAGGSTNPPPILQSVTILMCLTQSRQMEQWEVNMSPNMYWIPVRQLLYTQCPSESHRDHDKNSFHQCCPPDL
ncbi:hypothetical protein AVEN_106011-1 [Araneus ventricosus]|uniref:Uncharacterized protein n=1 Tax=Araneus ventricosus TaxID=182803 RepID=A0A4Y2NVY2_ARAVE|nr:hypothetical protein AVEN_193732-1 [Araneus ventricosus]GBN43893.1 hypothetical protein AVEN_106011-1 [Araneus ventricosus]